MKTIRNRTAMIILLAMLAFAFAGCGRDANNEETVPVEESPEPRWSYQTKTVEIAAGDEAVLFQQACEDSGFLALINRKTGDRIHGKSTELTCCHTIATSKTAERAARIPRIQGSLDFA